MLSDLDEWRSTARGRSGAPARRRSMGTILTSLLALMVLVASFGAALVLLANRAYENRIHPAVVLGDVPVGSLTSEEAADVLEARLGGFLEEPVTLRLGQRTWQPSVEELGLGVDIEASVRNAFAAGWERQVLLAAAGALLGREEPVTVPVVMTLDQQQLDVYFNDLAQQVNQDPVNPRVLISGDEVSVEGGSEGFTFLREETASALRRAVATLENRPVDVQVYASEGRISEASIRRAEEQARNVVSGPVLLETDGQRWEISPKQLGDWLRSVTSEGQGGLTELAVTLDEVEVENYLKRAAQELERPARSARLQWVDNRVQVLRPSEAGRRLEVEAATDAVQQAALSEARVVQLPVSPVPPRVSEASIQTLGISQLISTGESFYRGAPEEHVHNVRKASDAVTGYVVLPGDEFSFAEAVGELDEDQGYRPELVGDGERGLQGPWTGVTQVATTVFRAALYGGLPIQQRNAAPYRVPYFEQGAQPPGTEAVIALPDQDLRFQNDSSSALLVQVLVGDGEMRVELYGPNLRRDVDIAPPEVTNVIQPEGDVYWDDPASDQEGTILYAPAQAGQDVVIRRTIRSDGGPAEEETFFTAYEPLPTIYIGSQP